MHCEASACLDGFCAGHNCNCGMLHINKFRFSIFVVVRLANLHL